MTKNSITTVPKQILQKRFLLRTVLFVSLFSMLFMSLYQPSFAYSTTWFGFHSWKQAGVTVLFYVVAISTLVISKMLLFRFGRNHTVTVRRILWWHIVEFFAIATEYYLFSAYFKLGSVEIPQLLIRIPLCVALILAIPYAIIWLYAQYKAKKEELELFKLTHRRENLEPDRKLIKFSDSVGKHRMSINEDSIFYIESQDNYVQIFYELDGRMVSYLLRCSTQKIEEYLEDTTIVRCRRSFLVNTSKIIKYGREHGRLVIKLAPPSGKELTVTPAYYRTVLTRMDRFSMQTAPSETE